MSGLLVLFIGCVVGFKFVLIWLIGCMDIFGFVMVWLLVIVEVWWVDFFDVFVGGVGLGVEDFFFFGGIMFYNKCIDGVDGVLIR